MAKARTVFICQNCGANSPKWMGKCTQCGQWDTFQEEVLYKEPNSPVRTWKAGQAALAGNKSQAVVFQDIVASQIGRIELPDPEMNRVLGGGLVPGSIILIAGQPGIGKSTLLLQMALHLKNKKVLYVSGEESLEQIKLRGDRIGLINQNCLALNETLVSNILEQTQTHRPEIIVIDSIQTLVSTELDSAPGSISQVRECTSDLQQFAKFSNIPIFLIGHITKDGSIAGPKLLEHIVDVVLQFEGEHHHTYRIIRTLKNRFGATDELGIYEMRQNGLRPVQNPSELLLSHKEELYSGNAIAATLEGLRPMLIETQALVTRAVYGTPQRSATGFDLRRLSMLLAVLEKLGGFPFGANDVFLNIAGGLKVVDPAIDLAIVSALLSSLTDVAIPTNICFTGEIGLSGEIRAVHKIEQRIQEADKLGFKEIFISKYNLKGLNTDKYQLKIHPVAKVLDLYKALFQ